MKRRILKNLMEKGADSLRAVIPISLIVLLVFFFTPMTKSLLGMFLAGTILVIAGMSMFTLGADMAMIHVGELIGAALLKSRKTVLIATICCVLGIAVTVAEPDLSVLATQVSNINSTVLIISVAAGVGILLSVAVLRILFKWKLNRLLLMLYFPVFILALLVSKFAPEYLSVAFDSGGVTTGPITVPFILALGIGLSAVRGGKSSQDDSFGLVSLGSIGPIISVLALGLIQRGGEASQYAPEAARIANTTGEIGILFVKRFPDYLKEVLIALLPILVTFLLFQVFVLKLPMKELRRVGFGLFYTYIGLCCFLTGVNVGFMPAGSFLGASIAQSDFRWLLIPIGMLMGYVIVSAEPAVQVLNEQVETITGGAISRRRMMLAMSIGISGAIGIAMLRVLTGISIWWFVLPGYGIALGLSFFVKDFFTSIAFDSGGVASGPMTATFLLPFAMGACEALGGNILTDAFGLVAMVAMAPLITIQLMGILYRFVETKEENMPVPEEDFEIIEF